MTVFFCFFIKLEPPFKNPGSTTDKGCFCSYVMLLLLCGYVESNPQAWDIKSAQIVVTSGYRDVLLLLEYIVVPSW